MSPFEVHAPRPSGRRSGPPKITITNAARLGLSISAWKLLGSPDHVELLYDGENYLVALRKLDDPGPTSYKIHHYPKNANQVVAESFLKHNNIEARGRRFPAVMQGDLLVFDIWGQSEKASRKRRPPSSPPERRFIERPQLRVVNDQ